MANYRAIATGNWSNGATWAGGAVPPNGEGHNIYSNNFTVTIDTNVNVALITNAAITASFVGGGTSAAAGGGFTVSASGFAITGNITGSTATPLTFSAASPATLTITGNITAGGTGFGVNNTSTGSISILGNLSSTGTATNHAVNNNSTGNITVTSSIIVAGAFNGQSRGINNASTGQINLESCVVSGSGRTAEAGVSNIGAGVIIANNCTLNAGPALNNATGSITATNCTFTASTSIEAVTSSGGTTRLSGTFIAAANGRQPINSQVWILNSTPTNSYIQHALNGINANSFVRFYTADNALGQAAPTDVRSGVSYASGNLTGRLTVPARGSVALSVNYGPSMPFTATRSGTTATATMAYSYPLVVGDEFTVTGASNSEWSGNYTVASVVSGTSVTFTVPNTHSVTAGTGATMQTTGTAVLDPAAVASAVWGAGSRTITGGLVDTATTLTNAPTVPTPSQIASQVRTELSTELSRLDVATSTRAVAADIPTSDISAIKAKTDNLPASPAAVSDIPTADIAAIKSSTDNLPSDPADQSLVESAISALSIPTVVQIRTELDSNSTKLANLDATISSRSTLTTGDLPSVPSAASVASAVRTELTELSNLDASVSSRLASAAYTAPTSAPTAAAVASAVRSELTELSNLDASVSSRLASASYTAPANSDISAIKSKTDNLPASPAAVSDIPTTAQISAAVEGSLLNEGDGQAVLNAIVGAIGNQNLSEVSLVAAIRSDLERVGGKIDSIPTSLAPSASTVAGAVRTELATELGRLDASVSSRLSPSGTLATVTNLTNAPTVPSATDIATQVRTELATELARVDAAVSTRLAGSSYTAPANSDISAIKAKTDLLETTRLAQCSTVATTGAQLAAALS